MKYAAVIFDLDGTLLDTLQDLADAMNSVLKARGWPTHPNKAYRQFVGEGARNLVRRAVPPQQRTDAVIAGFLAEYQAAYRRNWNATTRPYDGIPELLDQLAARRIKMAVLSNKPEAFTHLCVQELLPRWKFEAVVGQIDSLPMKPDPAGPREIARMLDVPAKRFLYVGDSGVDMETAVNAGMFPVGALWGFRTKQELLKHGARKLVARPQELLTLIGE